MIKHYVITLVLAVTTLSAQGAEKHYWSADRTQWADVNGDGIMESVQHMKFETSTAPAIPEGAILIPNRDNPDYDLCYLPYELAGEYINEESKKYIRVEDGKYYCGLEPERFQGMPEADIRQIVKDEYGSEPVRFSGSDMYYVLITENNADRLPLNGGVSMMDGYPTVFYNGKLYVDVTRKFTSPAAATKRCFEGLYFSDITGKRVATIVEIELIDGGWREGWKYPDGYDWYIFDYTKLYITDTDGDGIPEIFACDNSYYKTMPATFMQLGANNVYQKASEFTGEYFDISKLVKTDVNLDGRPDYYFKGEDNQHYILMQKADHSFVKTQLTVTTDESVIGTSDYSTSSAYGNKFTKPAGGRGSISVSGLINDHVVSKAFDNISMSVDVNFDGYPDLIDTDKGGAFLSIGDGVTYFPAELGGKIEVADLNGDGMSDLVIFDTNTSQISVRLSSPEGYTNKNLLKNAYLSEFFMQDFDKDGDLDILLAMNGSDTGYSFLIFYANDGKGNFKKTENAYTGQYRFTECLDVEGNGTYTIVSDNYDTGVTLFNVPANLKPQPKRILETLDHLSDVIFIDYDNDGHTDLFYRAGYAGSTTYNHDIYSTTKNTIPSIMGRPNVLTDADKGYIRVEWPVAKDAESSVTDMTYMVAVGSTKGEYSYARMDAGRENYTMFRTVGWKPGEYQVSVMPIDGSGLKGNWSESTLYTHVLGEPDFTLTRNAAMVGDEVRVSLLSPYNPEYTYTYSAGDGSEITMSENGECVITFKSRGKKTVTLTVNTGSDVTDASRNITINASGKPSTETLSGIFADLDGDGVTEMITDKIEVNDGSGKFSPIGRLYNIDLWLGPNVFVNDWNLDGMPDVLATSSGKLLINEGDMDFAIEPATYTIIKSDNSTVQHDKLLEVIDSYFGLIDFDNDGRADIIGGFDGGEYGIYRNMGNNTFKKYPIPTPNLNSNYYVTNPSKIGDFNNDGLPDMLYTSLDSKKGAVAINRGNMTWELLPAIIDLNYGNFSNSDISVADVNNDGFTDFVIKYFYPETCSVIFWGDKDLTFEKITKIDGIALMSTGIDIDNDGCIDLIDDVKNIYYSVAGTEPWIEEYDYTTNPHPYEPDMTIRFADVNGDGTPDPKGAIMNTAVNARPSTPTGLTAVPSGKGVLLSWNASTDAETPAHQLRYIVSLKKKGAEGADSYIFSPMNSGLATALMQPTMTTNAIRSATSILVPIDRFDAKSEYEFSIQAIDLWNATSPVSETVTFTVGSIVDIESPAVTGQGVATDFRYVGTEITEQTWDWDGGNATLDSGIFKVVWNTPGVKTVTCSVGGQQAKTSILVKERPDLDFELPSAVLGGAPVEIKLPAIFANAADGASLAASENVEITMLTGEMKALIKFPSTAGRYFVEVVYNDDIFGTIGTQKLTEVIQFTPEIAIVAFDGTTSKNRVEWDASLVPVETGLFTKMRIYKETNRTNHFELIGEREISAGQFVDMQSNPSIRKNRYAIALGTTYGGETAMSTVHGSTHLMINRGLGSSLNLMWNPYEGGVVEQYVILRGSSPDNLEVLETLSGYENSFTDVNVPSGDCYYALSYSRLAKPMLAQGRARAKATEAPQSNVVCSRDASEVTFVEALAIKAVEDDITLDENNTRLHLYALVTPLRATFGDVQWRIINGSEYATISSEGTVSLTGINYTGPITVEAKAKDGSNVTATLTIPVKYSSDVDDISADRDYVELRYNATTRTLNVTGVDHTMVVRVYSISGNIMLHNTIHTDTVMDMNLVPGLYIVNVGRTSLKIAVR